MDGGVRDDSPAQDVTIWRIERGTNRRGERQPARVIRMDSSPLFAMRWEEVLGDTAYARLERSSLGVSWFILRPNVEAREDDPVKLGLAATLLYQMWDRGEVSVLKRVGEDEIEIRAEEWRRLLDVGGE